MMTPWKYNNTLITSVGSMPADTLGFIYEVTFDNGMKYVGSKYVEHTKTLKPLKGTRRKRKKKYESNWQSYYGSIKCPIFKKNFAEGNIKVQRRQILKFCTHKKQLSYWETKFLFSRDCLEKEDYYNSNILGKFFKKDV